MDSRGVHREVEEDLMDKMVVEADCIPGGIDGEALRISLHSNLRANASNGCQGPRNSAFGGGGGGEWSRTEKLNRALPAHFATLAMQIGLATARHLIESKCLMHARSRCNLRHELQLTARWLGKGVGFR